MGIFYDPPQPPHAATGGTEPLPHVPIGTQGSQPPRYSTALMLVAVLASWPADLEPRLQKPNNQQNKIAPLTLTYGQQPPNIGTLFTSEYSELVGSWPLDLEPRLSYPNNVREQLTPPSATAPPPIVGASAINESIIVGSWPFDLEPRLGKPNNERVKIAPLTLVYGDQPPRYSVASRMSTVVGQWPIDIGPTLPLPDDRRVQIAPLTLVYGQQPPIRRTDTQIAAASQWPIGVGPILPYPDWTRVNVAPLTLPYGSQPPLGRSSLFGIVASWVDVQPVQKAPQIAATVPALVNPRYWVGGGSSTNWDATGNTNWALTSGGANNASVPGSGNDVIFDANSGSGTSTIATGLSIRSLDMTGFTGTLTVSGGPTLSIAGNGTYCKFAATATYASNQFILQFTGTSGATLVTWNGVAFGAGGGMPSQVIQAGVGGTTRFVDNPATMTAGSVSVTGGTLDWTGRTITLPSLIMSGASVKSLNISGASITGTSAGTPWNISGSNNGLTIDTSSTITCNGAGATFAGGGLTYSDVTLSGSGTYTISGSNTFRTLTRSGGANTTKFTAGTTQTVTSFVCNGTSGNLKTLQSTSNGSGWNIVCASGTVLCDWVSLQDSQASGGAYFHATNAVNVSNNTGWIFDVPFQITSQLRTIRSAWNEDFILPQRLATVTSSPVLVPQVTVTPLSVSEYAEIVSMWPVDSVGPLLPLPNWTRVQIATLTLPTGDQPPTVGVSAAIRSTTTFLAWPTDVGPVLPWPNWTRVQVATSTLPTGQAPPIQRTERQVATSLAWSVEYVIPRPVAIAAIIPFTPYLPASLHARTNLRIVKDAWTVDYVPPRPVTIAPTIPPPVPYLPSSLFTRTNSRIVKDAWNEPWMKPQVLSTLEPHIISLFPLRIGRTTQVVEDDSRDQLASESTRSQTVLTVIRSQSVS